jgi:3-mercaptopyruvate sulfurtransferase SseA
VALTLRLKGIDSVRALLGGTTVWVRSGGELRKGSKP